jgi:hypothetical protein
LEIIEEDEFVVPPTREKQGRNRSSALQEKYTENPQSAKIDMIEKPKINIRPSLPLHESRSP